jgi:hypothetical protein
MKKRFKRIEFFLIITIILLILVPPAYLCCTQLSQNKFLSSYLSFENQEQKENMPDNGKVLKVYGASILLIIFLLGNNLFEQSSLLLTQSPSLHQKTFILRC